MINKLLNWLKKINDKISDEMLIDMGVNLKNKILILHTSDGNPNEIVIQKVKKVRYINKKKCIELSGRSIANDISIIIPVNSYIKLCKRNGDNFSDLNDVYIKSL